MNRSEKELSLQLDIQMKKYYQALDNTNGEEEIKPIMKAMEKFVAELPEKDKVWAEQDFKYYLTKHLQKSEDRLDRLKYEIEMSHKQDV